MRRVVLLGSLVPLALAACGDAIDEMGDIYSHGAAHAVLCGFSVDNKNGVSSQDIAAGLERAQAAGALLHLYAHRPAVTVDVSTIEATFANAAQRGLPFVTYAQLAADPQLGGAGLVFSFDDHDVAGWYPLRDLFARYDAKVTFFISDYHVLTDEEKQDLHQLEADGHAIEYHSTSHLNAPQYVAAHGMDAYIHDDILPDLSLMRAEGFDPKVFAYPGGARTPATDQAVLDRFSLVRAIQSTCPY